MVNPLAGPPPVHLQLGFTGAGAADAARQTGESGILARQPREAVLELGQLHLDLSLPAVGALREDVEDHLGAVDHLQLGGIGDRADLGGGQFVVEDEQVRIHLHGADDEIREFSLADQEPRIHLGPTLDDGIEHLDACGAAEFPQLRDRLLAVGKGFRFNADEDRAINGLHFARRLFFGELPFEGRDEGGKIEVHLTGALRIKGLPVSPLRVFGDQMGGAGKPGQAVIAGVDGADEVEAQERKVGEVVGGKLLAGEMGVDQPEPPETAGGGTETFEAGNQDVVVRSDDHISHFAATGDQNADLAVDLPG